MAKRQSGPRKKTRRKTGPKTVTTLRRQLVKTVLGLCILVVLVVGAGFLAHYLVAGRQLAGPVPAAKNLLAKTSTDAKPTFEIYPKEDIPLRKPVVELKGRHPKVALIIDDVGHDRRRAEKFINLGNELTFSILPYGPHQKEIAQKAKANGCEVMLHLPMEPLEYPTVDPGRGALLTSMTPDQLIDQLAASIDAVPHVRGINNHMGSKMTAESTQMYQIFSVLKKRKLYFIDSRTTEQTLCRPSARLFKVPFAARDIFIDNVQTPEAIREQLEKLVMIANRHGDAVGIGHPYPVTYEVLRKMLPGLRKKVKLVPASEVVKIVG